MNGLAAMAHLQHMATTLVRPDFMVEGAGAKGYRLHQCFDVGRGLVAGRYFFNSRGIS